MNLFRLAGRLHMTVSDLSDRLPMSEYIEWLAFDRIEREERD